MIEQIEEIKARNEHMERKSSITLFKNDRKSSSPDKCGDNYEVISLHISPELGERILISTDRNILFNIFPETNQVLQGTKIFENLIFLQFP